MGGAAGAREPRVRAGGRGAAGAARFANSGAASSSITGAWGSQQAARARAPRGPGLSREDPCQPLHPTPKSPPPWPRAASFPTGRNALAARAAHARARARPMLARTSLAPRARSPVSLAKRACRCFPRVSAARGRRRRVIHQNLPGACRRFRRGAGGVVRSGTWASAVPPRKPAPPRGAPRPRRPRGVRRRTPRAPPARLADERLAGRRRP